MEMWFLIVTIISILALLKALFDLLLILFNKPKWAKSTTKTLPPGPITLPILSTLCFLQKASSSNFEHWLGSLRSKFGPIITLYLGSQPHIFIFSRALAHEALVQGGSLFANRPKPSTASKITTHNQNISSATYGPTWRILRKNLVAQILHPSQVGLYSPAREQALTILINGLKSKAQDGSTINVANELQHVIFWLTTIMCFGDDISEMNIKHLEDEERSFLLALPKFRVLDIWPRLTKVLFPSLWRELLQRSKYQREVFIPLIRARKDAKNSNQTRVLAYLDTLLELEVQDDNVEDKRKLNEEEIVALCSEFLTAGSDTTSTTLQWIMANLVKYQNIQTKLFEEIKETLGSKIEKIKEEDLVKIPYLKAIILEGLRRHPPGHFLVPHGVTKEAELGDYLIPKNATIYFMAASIGWDPQVWDHPMEFKPKRFLGAEEGEGFDNIDKKGRGELKMMPFGVGRRICPGYSLAMLHLGYFVANLVWNFEWKAINGDEIDMSEKQQEFITVMNFPLIAHISPRRPI